MLNFLKKLFVPADDVFYVLFEEAADNCKKIVQELCDIVKEDCVRITSPMLARVRELKHSGNNINKQIILKLNETFITPIDREDIQSLSSSLNKISRKIVKAIFNLHIYRIENSTTNLINQTEILRKAIDELVSIIKLIRNTSKLEEATRLNNLVKEMESEGDDVMNSTIAQLFSHQLEPVEVMKYREVHKDIENALDLCYSASDEVLNILLKHN